MPSLDAPDAERFDFINRPYPDLTFERIVYGLETFRRQYTGKYWLEVMLLGGYTSLPAQVRQFATLTRRIRPDKVQLNTAVRPPAEEYAMAVPPERLAELARFFTPVAEVIAAYHRRDTQADSNTSTPAILELLRRRPCTEEDLASGLAMRPIELAKHLEVLEAAGRVASQRHGGLVYYQLGRHASSGSVSSLPSKLCGCRTSEEPAPEKSRATGTHKRSLRCKLGKEP